MILSEYDEKLHINNEKSQSFKEGKTVGKAEGVLELLEEKGDVPAELRAMILDTTDMDLLRSWLKGAARTESVEAFREEFSV